MTTYAAAAKAHSNGRINIGGKVSANGKAAFKANAFSKVNTISSGKAAVVKKTNSGNKASVKVAEEKTTSTWKAQKAYGTVEKTVPSKYKVDKVQAEMKGIFKLKPIIKHVLRKSKSPARTPSTVVKPISKQSPPFDKSAVSGITISTPEKLQTNPTNGYKQVHNSVPTLAVQIFISNLIVKQLKPAPRN